MNSNPSLGNILSVLSPSLEMGHDASKSVQEFRKGILEQYEKATDDYFQLFGSLAKAENQAQMQSLLTMHALDRIDCNVAYFDQLCIMVSQKYQSGSSLVHSQMPNVQMKIPMDGVDATVVEQVGLLMHQTMDAAHSLISQAKERIQGEMNGNGNDAKGHESSSRASSRQSKRSNGESVRSVV